MITAVLRTYPMLCYFQGFHDIVQVFLLVLGSAQATTAVAHLSLLRIRDFMLPSLSPSLAHLQLIPPILRTIDLQLYKHLSGTRPFFALAATLTLYAHEIQEYGNIARLFDFFLSHEAMISIYFFVVIVLSRREELFEIPADEPEMLHSVLSKLPRPLDLEKLISLTMNMFQQHPPSSLPLLTRIQISPYSVLRTTTKPVQDQSLEKGIILFRRQVVQLRLAERRQRTFNWALRHRTSAVRFSITVLLMVFSVWLQQNGWGSRAVVGLVRAKEVWRQWTQYLGAKILASR